MLLVMAEKEDTGPVPLVSYKLELETHGCACAYGHVRPIRLKTTLHNLERSGLSCSQSRVNWTSVEPCLVHLSWK